MKYDVNVYTNHIYVDFKYKNCGSNISFNNQIYQENIKNAIHK